MLKYTHDNGRGARKTIKNMDSIKFLEDSREESKIGGKEFTLAVEELTNYKTFKSRNDVMRQYMS